jgi:formyl-CoA transferase
LSAPYQAFRARDGYLTLAALTPVQWRNLCGVIGRDSLASDPRFESNESRMSNLPLLVKELESALAERQASEWVERLLAAGVPAGPILDYGEVFADEHTRARGMVESVQHPVEGTIRTLGFAVKMSDTPATMRLAPPLLGEHTDEVMSSLGIPGGPWLSQESSQ